MNNIIDINICDLTRIRVDLNPNSQYSSSFSSNSPNSSHYPYLIGLWADCDSLLLGSVILRWKMSGIKCSFIIQGIIEAFILSQIRIVHLLVFINVFSINNTVHVWSCVLVCTCIFLQRLIPPSVRDRPHKLFGLCPKQGKSLITCEVSIGKALGMCHQ